MAGRRVESCDAARISVDPRTDVGLRTHPGVDRRKPRPSLTASAARGPGLMDAIGDRRIFSPLAGGGYELDHIDNGIRVQLRHLRSAHGAQLHGEITVA